MLGKRTRRVVWTGREWGAGARWQGRTRSDLSLWLVFHQRALPLGSWEDLFSVSGETPEQQTRLKLLVLTSLRECGHDVQVIAVKKEGRSHLSFLLTKRAQTQSIRKDSKTMTAQTP